MKLKLRLAFKPWSLLSRLMSEAIREYVEREEAKERFKQDALTSWAAYQETGKHLTGQEVRDWLNTWGADKETEAPRATSNYY